MEKSWSELKTWALDDWDIHIAPRLIAAILQGPRKRLISAENELSYREFSESRQVVHSIKDS